MPKHLPTDWMYNQMMEMGAMPDPIKTPNQDWMEELQPQLTDRPDAQLVIINGRGDQFQITDVSFHGDQDTIVMTIVRVT